MASYFFLKSRNFSKCTPARTPGGLPFAGNGFEINYWMRWCGLFSILLIGIINQNQLETLPEPRPNRTSLLAR